MAEIIRAEAFIEWLARAGIVPEQTKRVRIECEAGGRVRIYAQLYATTDLIGVDPPEELRKVGWLSES